MSSKAPHYPCDLTEPGVEQRSTLPTVDFDDRWAMRVVAVLVGLYLLVTVLVLRGVYNLPRLLPSRRRRRSSPAHRVQRTGTASRTAR